jgi:dephospho-CoA kinase
MWLQRIIIGNHVNNRLFVVELICGFFLTLPICIIYSQCEKRYLVRSKQPIKYIKIYRIIGWSLLLQLFIVVGYLFDQGIFPIYSTTTTILSQQSMSQINPMLLNLIRMVFILIGIYLGQSFCPIAITGSIATGKSTVEKLLVENNIPTVNSVEGNNNNVKGDAKLFRIIDLDKIGHDIILSPSRLSSKPANGIPWLVKSNDSVYPKILQTFGDTDIDYKNILDEDNEIDRRKLGDIIFQDPNKRRILNHITHPRIRSIMMQQILMGTYFNPKSIICADIPLLYETRTVQWLFPCVIVVACTRNIQYERLHKRNPDLSEEQCRQRIASQLPIERKVAQADIVIWNNGNVDDLMKEVNIAKLELIRRMNHGSYSWYEFLVVIGVLVICFFL